MCYSLWGCKESDVTEHDILILRLTIHEHRISLYEFRSTMNSFRSACDFTTLNLHTFYDVYMSLNFGATVNVTDFTLIPDYLLIVY